METLAAVEAEALIYAPAQMLEEVNFETLKDTVTEA